MDHRAYDAFGNITSETAPTQGDRYGFQGTQWDSVIQEEDDGIRIVNTPDGRFTTMDPSGLTPDSDPFRFIGNGPTNATGPTGLAAEDDQPLKGQAGKDKVAEALALFLKSTPAKDLFEKVRKDLGGTLDVQFDPTIPVISGWNSKKKTIILVNPNIGSGKSDLSFDVGGILIEVLNASHADLFDMVNAKAGAGDLSRIDYAVAIEKIEYDSLVTHHEIVSAAVKAGIWAPSADRYGKIDEVPFYLYLGIQVKTKHSQIYGKQWGVKYEEAWTKKHPNDDPDQPVEDLTKNLDKRAIKALQKAFGAM